MKNTIASTGTRRDNKNNEVSRMKRCTMCGKKFDVWDEQENFCFQHRVGYGSAHDGDVICLKLCCNCFDRVIDIISLMSNEKIIISPQEWEENSGYYGKQVKVRGLYSPLTHHIGRQSRPFQNFSCTKNKNHRRLSGKE